MNRILIAVFSVLINVPLCLSGTLNIYMDLPPPLGNGDDGNFGTEEDPVATLNRAQVLVNLSPNNDYIIHVKGGTYEDQTVNWITTDPINSLIIQPYNNEIPVFDGNGLNKWFHLDTSSHSCTVTPNNNDCYTNVTIKGMTVKNYVEHAIVLRGLRGSEKVTNGGNLIEENTFIEIGNAYVMTNCIMNNPESCIGYGTVDLVNSDENTIRNNNFIKNENSFRPGRLHAVYLAHNSSDNEVYENFMSQISGDPVRVRDASDNNIIKNNYSERSGKLGFISGWHGENESPSANNSIDGNTITFPYLGYENPEIELVCSDPGCDESTFVVGGEEQNYFNGIPPQNEKIGALVSGDFNGDGRLEIVVAFNYDDFVKVVSSTGKNNYLSKVLYTSTSFKISSMTAGNFLGQSGSQLLTYFKLRSTGRTDVFLGNGVDSLGDHGLVYRSDIWEIQAMTSGDFDGNGYDESIVSFKAKGSGETRVYKGDGVNSLSNMGKLYTSKGIWDVTAFAAGDFDKDGKSELITALDRGSEVRIYRGNAVTSILNEGYLYSSTYWSIPAMTVGNFSGSSTLELITAFNANGETRLYRGNGVTSAVGSKFYTSNSWDINGLVSGEFNNDITDGAEITTAFTSPTNAQIWVGNGTTSATEELIYTRD